MITVILAAGFGSRLMPLTKDIPKTLLEIEGMTILERLITQSIDNGINEFIIISGHKKERVEEKAQDLINKYNIKIDILENKDYLTTNTSVSTLIATKIANEDIILINGDNVFDKKIMDNIVSSSGTSLVIDNVKNLNEESFKLKIENGIVTEIGKHIDIASALGEFIGVSKVAKSDFPEFNSILEDLINKDPQNYYDYAFKTLSEKTKIGFVYTEGAKWTEIDDKNDWEMAKQMLKDLA
ncbi:MAG: sugar phosphate nucleotidyltransferase [Methanobacteriaceae archaeon]